MMATGSLEQCGIQPVPANSEELPALSLDELKAAWEISPWNTDTARLREINPFDAAYIEIVGRAIEEGVFKSDRTGTGTISIFGHQSRFNLSKGFPLLTTKSIHKKSVIHELLWFLTGSTNIGYLQDHGVKIWDDWADLNGELGPVYGKQWRDWVAPDGRHIDQISDVIHTLKTNPDSRRIIVTAWNPADVDQMALPPCHAFFQLYVSPAKQPGGRPKLSCQLYQRSADIFIGVPFNIASYALLTMMIAQVCDMDAGEFIHTFGDTHIYSNHFAQVALQISREPMSVARMVMNPRVHDIFGFVYDDFIVEGYNPRPGIKAPVAV